MGFPHLWTITHSVAAAGNKQWSWVDRKPPKMGINFGSVPKPTMKVSTITAAAGDETLRRQKVFEHFRQSVGHLCLLPFSFLPARIITWIKGSKIYWLWPCNFIIFWSSSGTQRNSEVPVTSWEGNCASFSCGNSMSWEAALIFFCRM